MIFLTKWFSVSNELRLFEVLTVKFKRFVPPGLQLFYDVSRAIADGLHHKIVFILKYIEGQHFFLKTGFNTGMPCYLLAET
jgi:hypothetical protein